MTNTKRIEKLEAEVRDLREKLNLLLAERRGALEARDRDIRRQIGVRP